MTTRNSTTQHIPNINLRPTCPMCKKKLHEEIGYWICKSCTVIWQEDGTNGELEREVIEFVEELAKTMRRNEETEKA